MKGERTAPAVFKPQVVEHEKRVVKTAEELRDFFDLSRFNSSNFGDVYDRIHTVEEFLSENCNKLGTEPLIQAVNPIRISSGYLEYPVVNSHGELEFWIYDKRVFDFSKRRSQGANIRAWSGPPPEGALLCMDTKKLFSPKHVMQHGVLGLGEFEVYGNVKFGLSENRHVPGKGYFIELGAISYSDLGNTWSYGVLGGKFDLEAVARE